MRLPIFYGMLIFLLLGCSRKQQDNNEDSVELQIPLQYAKGFAVYKGEGYYRVDIRNSKDTLDIIETYYLVTDSLKYKRSTDRFEISIPVKEIASISTTHIGFLAAFDKQSQLAGITGSRWVHDEEVKAGLESGSVTDIGADGLVDHERLIGIQPDVLLAYESGLDAEGQADQIRRFGIPVVLINEYLEDHPLGMAEWGKLFALLMNNPESGELWFNELSKEYQAINEQVKDIEIQPSVMTGLPFRGEWTISGGKSFAATFLDDAGANYLWKDDERVGNYPVSIEEVLQRATDANIWVNPGAAGNIQRILETDSRLKTLEPIKSGMVFNNNKRVNEHGGNDYWESAVAKPQRVLKDLALIFHPNIFPNDTLYYYTQLK